MSNSESSISTIFHVRTDFKVSKEKGQKRAPTPVNVIIWAMEILGKRTRGVPIHKIRSLIKKHFVLPCRKSDVDKKIDMTVMFAVYFGILEKANNLFYLKRTDLLLNESKSKLTSWFVIYIKVLSLQLNIVKYVEK